MILFKALWFLCIFSIISGSKNSAHLPLHGDVVVLIGRIILAKSMCLDLLRVFTCSILVMDIKLAQVAPTRCPQFPRCFCCNTLPQVV